MTDENENDVNHVLRPLQSLDLNLVEHLWEKLDQPVRILSPPTSIHQLREYLLEELCSSLQYSPETWRINDKEH